MHKSEINRLRKVQTALPLAASDLDQAAAAARALDAEADDQALMRALETAIAVCYARAFTTRTLLQLGIEYAPAVGTTEAELDEFLTRLRDKVYAHTDKASGRTISTIISTEMGPDATVRIVEWREEWLPFPLEYIPPVIDLCERQALRFRTEVGQNSMQHVEA